MVSELGLYFFLLPVFFSILAYLITMSNKDKTSTKTDLLHLVYSVTNIRNKVRVLDGTTVSYSSWATHFQLHARAYSVFHHIDGTNGPTRDDPSYDFWVRIDSVVLQWIYGTLSDELLVLVLESDSTAFQAWSRIKSIFVNNKGSRAADREHEFMNLTLRYCQKLKEIADQRLVLKLLKDLAERLPPGSYDVDSIKIPSGLDFNPDTNGDNHAKPNLPISPTDTSIAASTLGPTETFTETKESTHVSNENHSYSDARSVNRAGVDLGNKYSSDNAASQGENNGFQTRNPASNSGNNTYNTPDQVEAEWIEQYEPGVYITLVALRDGTRDLKRVRFSRRRFGEHQAETWWSENRENVYERYNVRGSDKASVSAQSARQSAETLPSPAQY